MAKVTPSIRKPTEWDDWLGMTPIQSIHVPRLLGMDPRTSLEFYHGKEHMIYGIGARGVVKRRDPKVIPIQWETLDITVKDLQWRQMVNQKILRRIIRD